MKHQDMKKISSYVFQTAIGFIFGYFGILALINPDIEAAKWLSQGSASLIELLMPIGAFMLMLGAVQLAIALLLVADKFSKAVLPFAAVMLVGIIINLGLNEIALRDFVILTGVSYLYFSNEHDRVVN